ncbi:hypothetical protein DFQ26_008627 [Actinomortierella ambigua]|nr:hypothetical protein DFQ26_008627 [Actinomortierella ambigua]
MDWLKQKPTRSTTHMIHTYNYSGHNYYQTPGKTPQNVNRNMAGYTNLRTFNGNNTGGVNRSTSGPIVTSTNGASTTTIGPSTPSSIKSSAATSSHDVQQRTTASGAAASLTISTTGLDGGGGGGGPSMPSPSSGPPSSASSDRPRSVSGPITVTTQHSSHFNGHFYGHGHGIQQYNTQPVSLHVHVPAENEEPLTPANQHIPHHHHNNKSRKNQPPVGRLTMSRAKLTSPSVNSLSSSELENSSPQSETMSAPTSPHPGSGSGGSGISHDPPLSPSRTLTTSSSTTTSLPPPLMAKSKYRPSTTISSLRVLLANHPHGMSLVESLEDGDEDEDSCSETETNESEEDARARMQERPLQHDSSEHLRRKRPPPNFEWMNARRRFSSSSLSTISREIRDSQKGQHALWKYIGGGNFHAHIRYDIGRILDSGCGLGEWTMEMAKEFPNATVYGIDINPELFPDVHQNVPSNCLFSQSDLLGRLCFPDQYFDFVYQRFLYLGLTVDDWPVALKELHRVMKPGAWIELFEPCMRMHRAGPRTRQVLRWISKLLQENRGLDFDFAGEKMRQLCESPEVGFVNVRIERLSIPVGSWGGRVGEAMAENMVLMFQNLKAALATLGAPAIPSAAASGDEASTMASTPTSATTASSTPTSASIPLDDTAWHNSFDTMVQSWVRECETNKSYFDYYILVGQRAP